MKKFILIFLILTAPAMAGVVPLKDNFLVAFEKCKSLSVNLERGQLKEAVVSSFDLHCMKVSGEPFQMKCEFFENQTDKKTEESLFTGGSELGVAAFSDKQGRKIKFLIGKQFASFESPEENKVCAGIYLFEKDALKKKAGY
ncbi:MAG: hypothetical protein ACLGHN_09135 [Bacteriovoracia bacterium]